MNYKAILVFDHDAEYLKLVSSFFQLEGYRVVVSRKVSDCLSKLDRQKFSCLVLDGKSSQDLEKIISYTLTSGQPNQNVPIVVTPMSLETEISQSSMSLVQLILKKPFEMTDLYGTVEKLTRYDY